MKLSLFDRLEAVWGIKKEFRLKVFFLSLSFFMLMACQAIWRPLKSSVFISLVGAKQIPYAKIYLMFPILILILIYSKLVNLLRRHHLFYWFAISHGLVGILMYFLLKHPAYGVTNTAIAGSRTLGWAFYFFMESFGAFMSTVFWSFANSVNKPKDAKNYYSVFVAGSKIGGILGAGSLFLITLIFGMAKPEKSLSLVPNFVLAGSLLIFAAAGAIYLLMKYVPGYLMHGYEASYQFEKKKSKEEKKEKKTIWKSMYEVIEGLVDVIRYPYVFGILTMILSYEVIIVIIDYLFALAAEGHNSNVIAITNYYALYMLLMHSIGFFIAVFGTAPIQRFLGIRLSLFACPAITVLVLMVAYLYPTAGVVFAAVVVIRGLNYGLNHPTRETLFIPTTKAIKFKAKAWTDAFGSRFSKASGSGINTILQGSVHISALVGLCISAIWIVIAYFLGKTCAKTIANNEVIGAEESSDE